MVVAESATSLKGIWEPSKLKCVKSDSFAPGFLEYAVVSL